MIDPEAAFGATMRLVTFIVVLVILAYVAFFWPEVAFALVLFAGLIGLWWMDYQRLKDRRK